VDGTLVYTTVHEDTPKQGRVGFFADTGSVTLAGLELAELKPERTYRP